MKTVTSIEPCPVCGQIMMVETHKSRYDYETTETCNNCGHFAVYTQYRDDVERT